MKDEESDTDGFALYSLLPERDLVRAAEKLAHRQHGLLTVGDYRRSSEVHINSLLLDEKVPTKTRVRLLEHLRASGILKARSVD